MSGWYLHSGRLLYWSFNICSLGTSIRGDSSIMNFRVITTWCRFADCWFIISEVHKTHYSDVMMNPMASLTTGVSIASSAVCSGTNKKNIKVLRYWPLWIHRWPVNSPYKWPVMRKMFPFDDVIMHSLTLSQWSSSGFPVAIQCAWNSDPSVHWNATGEMPVCFQWCSSGLPVAFQWSSSVFQLCKLTLDRHWNTTGR